MKVFEALYNPMTEESGTCTLSIHLSRKGAEQAICFHKNEAYKEWRRRYTEENEPFEFGRFEYWGVNEVDVLP